jgi:peroxiredoxin
MRLLPLACLIVLWPLAVPAQVSTPASGEKKLLSIAPMEGEAFENGPRHSAVLLESTGKVDFPITTAEPQAQLFFSQGVGQLHGLAYFEAERSFRQAATLDPECAMAHWGMAMANINNPKRASRLIKNGWVKMHKLSRREQLWYGSLYRYYEYEELRQGESTDDSPRRAALIKSLEDLSYEFPADLEAKAFLVFHLLDNARHKMPLPSRQLVDALMHQVLAVNPQHPGQHYLIHLWNGSERDERALRAAAGCGPSAASTAQMWQMPALTYANLRRYDDVVWQLEAAARVDHASLVRTRTTPEDLYSYPQNCEWLAESLACVGRVHDAVHLAKQMIELPRLGPKQGRALAAGRERLLKILVQFEQWEQLLALEKTPYLAPADSAQDEVRRLSALAVANFQTGDIERGEEKLAALDVALKTARLERIAAADAAAQTAKFQAKTEEQIAKIMTETLRSFDSRVANTEWAIAEVRVYQALAAQKLDIVKALLSKAPAVPAERRSRILFAIGDQQEAVNQARIAVDANPNEVQPLANLADLLWQTKQPQSAQEAFEKLRALCAGVDLDLPTFSRLAPLAAALQLPTDWRVTAKVSADVGARPDLDSLGPLRWQPYPAAAWTLPNNQNRPQSLSDFRGRPVLVMFYLGSGCAHCIEQLNAFNPLTKDFAAAGIPILAVSTDSPEGLHKTMEKAKSDGGFLFPIVSDASLETFKSYRAFDDFERVALHGTFLIDGDGWVRWQNISADPFNDAAWLLAEAKRLLSFPVPGPQATARK